MFVHHIRSRTNTLFKMNPGCRKSVLAFTIAVIAFSCSKDNSEDIILTADPSSVAFSSDGGQEYIAISSSAPWSISSAPEWLSVSPSEADGNATLSITAQANSEELSRTATLHVNAGAISRQIHVAQSGTGEEPPQGFQYAVSPDNTDMRDLNSVEFSQLMTVGWNIGNSLDAIGGETAWGNPLITQQLIDSVKAAGFNAIRLPVAWSKFTSESAFIIDPDWLARVEEVVNYILKNEMYVIMNIHWDGGWMQPTYDEESYVNNRLAVMWEQIATYFRDYSDYLLFAGTNEVMVEGDYGTPTSEYYTVQNGFNQTFVTTVRATGGRNAYRQLVIQGFNTNIDHTVNFAVMPEDVIDDRLLMEVHYYDPYNFTLNENSSVIQWGATATDPAKTETWANEAYADGQFQKMKSHFIDKGVGVILGEYGAISRTALSEPDKSEHAEYRRLYMEYITQSAREHGLVPFYWDNGYSGNYGFAIFDRSTGKQIYPELIDAIVHPGE